MTKAKGRRCFLRSSGARNKDMTQWKADPEKSRKLDSYGRYLSIGLLLVNRKWPCMLAEPLHYELDFAASQEAQIQQLQSQLAPVEQAHCQLSPGTTGSKKKSRRCK